MNNPAVWVESLPFRPSRPGAHGTHTLDYPAVDIIHVVDVLALTSDDMVQISVPYKTWDTDDLDKFMKGPLNMIVKTEPKIVHIDTIHPYHEGKRLVDLARS